MRPRSNLIFGLVLLFSLTAATQKPPASGENRDPVAVAIDHLRNLEYDPAKQQLRDWVETHPDDLRAQNYLATATLYQEMFRRGVLEAGVYGEGGDVFKPNRVPSRPNSRRNFFPFWTKPRAWPRDG